MLWLTALLLPIDDVEVDFGGVGDGLLVIGWDLYKKHVLDMDYRKKNSKIKPRITNKIKRNILSKYQNGLK